MDENELKNYVNNVLEDKTKEELEMVKSNNLENMKILEEKIFKIVTNHSSTHEATSTKIKCFKGFIQDLAITAESLKSGVSISEKKLKWISKDIQKLNKAKVNLERMAKNMKLVLNIDKISARLDQLYGRAVKLINENFSTSGNEATQLFTEKISIYEMVVAEYTNIAESKKSESVDFILLAGLTRLKPAMKRLEVVRFYFIDCVYEDFARFKVLNVHKIVGSQIKDLMYKVLKCGCLMIDSFGKEGLRAKEAHIEWIIELHVLDYEKKIKENLTKLGYSQIKNHITYFSQMMKEYRSKYQFIVPKSWNIPLLISKRFCSTMEKNYEVLNSNSMLAVPEHIAVVKLISKFENELRIHFSDEIKPNISTVLLANSASYILAERNKLKSAVDRIAFLSKKKLLSRKNMIQSRITETDEVFLIIKQSLALYQTIQIFSVFIAVVNEFKFALNRLFFELENLFLHHCISCPGDLNKDAINKNNFETQLKNRSNNNYDEIKEKTLVFLVILKTVEKQIDLVSELNVAISDRYKENQFSQESLIDFDDNIEFLESLSNNMITKMVREQVSESKNFFCVVRKMKWTLDNIQIDPNKYALKLSTFFNVIFSPVAEKMPEELFLLYGGRFATAFFKSLKKDLFRCRKVNKNGAEQLLVDIYTIKSSLNNAFTQCDKICDSVKMVIQKAIASNILPIESALKGLSSDNFSVTAFCALFPKCSLREFEKILKMKSLSKENYKTGLDSFKNYKKAVFDPKE